MSKPTVLGIDPGTACGWSLFTMLGETPLFGLMDLSVGRYESAGMRFVRFKQQFERLLDAHKPTLVAFEEVRAHMGVDAAHVYGGIVAMLQSVCIERKVEYTAIPVGTVKKTATGNGGASKEVVLLSARETWAGFKAVLDNGRDALVCAHPCDVSDALWIGQSAWNQLLGVPAMPVPAVVVQELRRIADAKRAKMTAKKAKKTPAVKG